MGRSWGQHVPRAESRRSRGTSPFVNRLRPQVRIVPNHAPPGSLALVNPDVAGESTQCGRWLVCRWCWHRLPRMDPAPPIRVNRAPVLTLWAAVVAERMGYAPDTALTLGRFVAGSSARAKARRLGISDEKQEAEERHARAAELKPRRQTVHLLGRDIPVLAAGDGTLRAEDDGKPASAKSVQAYIARAFGDRRSEARAAMDALAAS